MKSKANERTKERTGYKFQYLTTTWQPFPGKMLYTGLKKKLLDCKSRAADVNIAYDESSDFVVILNQFLKSRVDNRSQGELTKR